MNDSISSIGVPPPPPAFQDELEHGEVIHHDIPMTSVVHTQRTPRCWRLKQTQNASESHHRHTDIRMVSKHYGHLAPNALADAVRALAPKLGLGGAPKVTTLKVAGAAK